MKSRIKITMSETKANLLSSMAILITMAIISSIFHTTNAEGPLFECPKGKKINFSISVLAANNDLYLSLVKKSIQTFNWLLIHLNTGVVKTMSPIELNLITNTLSFFVTW